MVKRKKQIRKYRKLRALGKATFYVLASPVLILSGLIREASELKDHDLFICLTFISFIATVWASILTANPWVLLTGLILTAILGVAAALLFEESGGDC